jgi:hypothetical protein
MRTLFQNEECIILYDDYSFLPNQSEATRVTTSVGFDALAMAQEVWLYKNATKRFYAYKNRGLINEAIERMLDRGIKLKSFGASINSGTTTELCFATPKDQFIFELKF